PPRDVQVFVPGGCARCDGSGYRGRVGVYELLVVTPRMRERIVRRAPTDAVMELARAEGFTSMGQDAWAKVQAGLTSIAEVAPLLALAQTERSLCRTCGSAVRASFAACPGCGTSLRPGCSCGARLDP